MTTAVADRTLRTGGHDLRLAVGAVAAWIAAAIALSSGPLGAAVMAGVAGLIGAAALALRHSARAIGAVIALAAFCVVLVLAPLSARLAVSHGSELAQLARARVDVTAEVTLTGDPRPLVAKGVAGSPRAIVDAHVDSVLVAGRPVDASGPVVILGPAGLWHDALPGQRLRLDATVQPPLDGDLLTATLLAQSDPQLIGQPPWWQRAAGRVRSSLRAASSTLPSEEAGLLPGLIDGDTTQLDPVLSEHFRIAGLTHLVAVSGTNCAIVVGAVLLVLRRARVGPRTCAVVGAFALVAFVVVARPSPSVLRAAVMAAIALWCLASGRERVAVPALSATALVLLVWQPQLAADAGFAMSALATASLLLIAPGWAEALRRRRVPGGVAEALAVAAAANVVTAPVIAAISGRISLVSIPANLLAEPVVAVVTVIGFVAALVSPLNLGAGTVLAQVAGWPCRWLIWVADFFGGLHGATLAWPGGTAGGLALLAATLALVWLARRAGARRSLAAFAVVSVIVLIPVRAAVAGWPPTGWIFVACDVGQGDGLVLPAGGHSAVVIDSGPDPVAIDRCLTTCTSPMSRCWCSRTTTSTTSAASSASFTDGRSNRSSPARSRCPRPESSWSIRCWPPPPHDRAGPGRHERADRGGPARLPRADRGVSRHAIRSEQLVADHPCHRRRQAHPAAGRRRDRGPAVDARIRASTCTADVLKVPHHGSAYSDPRFLAAVHAQVGIISVGAGNDYGLPSPVLLTELARLDLPVLRTDRDGDIAVVDSGGTLSTVTRGIRASSVG